MKNNIGIFESIKEIFGRGYSLSYRLFRLRELIEPYFNLTVIPASFLGCLTTLFITWFNFTVGINDIPSLTATMFTVLFFLVVMTAEDVYTAIVSALRRVG